MIGSPCKNCKDRTIPKQCEKTCQKWKEYKESLAKENNDIKMQKTLNKRINESIWRNFNKQENII